MSITLEQAKALARGVELHHAYHVNSDGSCRVWRVNGVPRTWKRDPDRVEIPIKYGLKICDTLTQDHLHLVHVACDCPYRQFKSLPVGARFRFRREGMVPPGGMAQGPWIKTGSRKYVSWEEEEAVSRVGEFRVGSINAWVVEEQRP